MRFGDELTDSTQVLGSSSQHSETPIHRLEHEQSTTRLKQLKTDSRVLACSLALARQAQGARGRSFVTPGHRDSRSRSLSVVRTRVIRGNLTGPLTNNRRTKFDSSNYRLVLFDSCVHPLNKSQKILGHVNWYVKIWTVYFSSQQLRRYVPFREYFQLGINGKIAGNSAGE